MTGSEACRGLTCMTAGVPQTGTLTQLAASLLPMSGVMLPIWPETSAELHLTALMGSHTCLLQQVLVLSSGPTHD